MAEIVLAGPARGWLDRLRSDGAGHRCRAGARGDRAAVGAGAAVADAAAGSRSGAVGDGLGAGADGGAVPAAAARFHQFPDPAAADDAAAPVAERGHHAADPVARQRGTSRRRPCGGGVRRLPDGRGRGDRGDPVLHPAGGELHGHHQGFRPDRRSRRALQPGCDAGQADGDRRRDVRRHDRRGHCAPPAAGAGGGERLLRRDGRRGQIRPRRRDRRADHHRDQHLRRSGDRAAAPWHAVRRSGRDLHHADRGRWAGVADTGAAGLHRGRHRGDQGRHGGHRGRGADPPARQQPEAAGHGGRRGRRCWR